MATASEFKVHDRFTDYRRVFMEDAITVASRQGLFKTIVKAVQLRSSEEARKLWPFVTPSRNGSGWELVTWVRPSFTEKKSTRAYFRRITGTTIKPVSKHFVDEMLSWQRTASESLEHKKAKDLIAQELQRRLATDMPLYWSYKDENTSDCAFKGNLLLGAKKIDIESRVKTPYGQTYRLDIAVLGEVAEGVKTPMIIGGIEIEMDHPFNGMKALLCRTLAFPLISVDISEMTLDEITEEWAKKILSNTTKAHESGRRKTFVYLHDLLYPQFAVLPDVLKTKGSRHQFVVFAETQILQKMVSTIGKLPLKLGFKTGEIALTTVNGVSEQSRKMLENLGFVVGSDWQSFNSQECLLITLDRPESVNDYRRHHLHMIIAKLLAKENALVGYKYRRQIHNWRTEQDSWTLNWHFIQPGTLGDFKILPKRLHLPITKILQLISEIKIMRDEK